MDVLDAAIDWLDSNADKVRTFTVYVRFTMTMNELKSWFKERRRTKKTKMTPNAEALKIKSDSEV